MNCHANKSIECTVVSCANHCDEANYCSLDKIHGRPVHRLHVLPQEIREGLANKAVRTVSAGFPANAWQETRALP